MTTIAYRNGILAGDSRAYSGDRRPLGWKKKVHHLDNGGLFGASSNLPGTPEKFLRWVNANGVWTDYPEEINCAAIVVNPDGSVWRFEDRTGFTGPITADFFAIGSGEDYAMAAMAMGASAAKAVAIAREFDIWTDGEIHEISL